MNKTFRVLCVALFSIHFAGCLPLSLNSWFEGEKRVFDESFLGRWVTPEGPGEDEVWTFRIGRGKDDCYRVKWMVREEGHHSFRHNLTACLMKIDGTYFVDFTGIDWESDEEGRPVHGLASHLHHIARVQYEGDTIRLHFLKEEPPEGWRGEFPLDELTSERSVEIGNDFEASLLILDDTATLQKFLEKHSGEEGIWEEEPIAVLVRK